MPIIVAKNEKQVDEAIKALMSNSKNPKRLIGVDTIAMPPLASAGRITSLAALQLCDQSQFLIIRLPCFGRLPESLYNFLSLPSFTFVGFGMKDAMASLREEYGLLFKNTLEAGQSWIRFPLSLSEKRIDMHIPPIHCISGSWHPNDELTQDLINLAVSNVRTARCIGDEGIYVY